MICLHSAPPFCAFLQGFSSSLFFSGTIPLHNSHYVVAALLKAGGLHPELPKITFARKKAQPKQAESTL